MKPQTFFNGILQPSGLFAAIRPLPDLPGFLQIRMAAPTGCFGHNWYARERPRIDVLVWELDGTGQAGRYVQARYSTAQCRWEAPEPDCGIDHWACLVERES